MIGPGSHPAAPTAIWFGVASLALLGSVAGIYVTVPVAAGGALIAFTLQAPLVTRALIAVAMIPIAFVDSSPAWAWVGACAAIGFATTVLSRRQADSPPNGNLPRHLEWCRRREERSHLLVVPLARVEDHELSGLLESFRITDSVTLGRQNGGVELYALLDDKGFVREGIERRLSELRGGRSSFGWATFPDDGVTIQTLIDHARAEMSAAREHELGVPSEAPQPSAAAPALEHTMSQS